MAKRLAGKVAIVTGAGRGIGRGEALALASGRGKSGSERSRRCSRWFWSSTFTSR